MMQESVEIDEIKNELNKILRAAHKTPEEVRAAIGSVLLELLLKSNKYHGFRYLSREELDCSFDKPGVNVLDCGCCNFEGTDPTRVQYL